MRVKKRVGILAATSIIAIGMIVSLNGCSKTGEEKVANDDTYESPLIVSDDDEPSLVTENENSGISDDLNADMDTESENDLSGEEDIDYADMYADDDDVSDEDIGLSDDDTETPEEDTDFPEEDSDISDSQNTYKSELYNVEMLNGTGDAGYNVSTENYSSTKKVTINYPRITNWSSDDRSEWNKLFKNEAKLEQAGLGYKDSATMDFEITQMNDTYLSIVTTVDEVINGAAHPYAYCYTYNIDMTTGDKVVLKDLVNVSKLAEVLMSGEGYEIENDDITMEDILDYQYFNGKYTVNTLAKDLKYVDMDPKKVQNNGGGLFAQSYIDDGRIVLVFDVSHAMGDYATVIID